MKILLVNKYYYLKAGAERYVFNLKRLLEEKGHTVEVFAMQHPRNETAAYQQDFVPYLDFRNLSLADYGRAALQVLWSPNTAQRISRVLDLFHPDLVSIHNIYHQLSPSLFLPIRQRGIPVVQRLHDYKLLCPNYQLYTQGMPCTRCRNGNFFQAVRYRCLHGSRVWSLLAAIEMTLHKRLHVYERHVAIFTTPSRFMRDMALTFGIPDHQVRHIPNFVYPESASSPKRDEGYLTYIGRLAHEKGLETLLRAMKQIPSARLRLIGEGPLRPKLEQITAELGLNNVTFCGYLRGHELVQTLAQARVSVLPSEWYENSPQSLIESFWAGTPVIGSRIGSIPELIDDGQDGLLFPAGNVDALAACIRQMWEHPQQSRDMGMNGQKKVLTYYTPDTHYAQLFPLYEAFVNGDYV